MNLYLLRLTEAGTPESPYDIARGFVVAACDEKTARRFASTHCGRECSCQHGRASSDCVWRYGEYATATLIGRAVEGVSEGIVLRDFCAG